jgi:glycosyltransferase involved in cell wall biosynthesis
MSTVAIVMTTYNGEKYVEEQIKSILASAYQDFELYIFDDGSSDATISILERYDESYQGKVHMIRNEMNYGVTMNFIQALSKMTTDYIMFCDQDDVWLPNKISITLKRMRHMEGQMSKDSPIANRAQSTRQAI